jgi:hypothetical protein
VLGIYTSFIGCFGLDKNMDEGRAEDMVTKKASIPGLRL